MWISAWQKRVSAKGRGPRYSGTATDAKPMWHPNLQGWWMPLLAHENLWRNCQRLGLWDHPFPQCGSTSRGKLCPIQVQLMNSNRSGIKRFRVQTRSENLGGIFVPSVVKKNKAKTFPQIAVECFSKQGFLVQANGWVLACLYLQLFAKFSMRFWASLLCSRIVRSFAERKHREGKRRAMTMHAE